MLEMVKRPYFFKIFLPNISTEHLKIPIDFFKHLEGKTSGTVTLMGPSGNTWHVELIKSNDDGLFLQDGWPIFVRDHHVQIGEFFVFRYDGNLHFTVQIFDTSGCQKEAAFCVKSSQDTTSDFAESKEKMSVGFEDDPEGVTQKRIKIEKVNLPMREMSSEARELARSQSKRSISWNAVTRSQPKRRAKLWNVVMGSQSKKGVNSWNRRRRNLFKRANSWNTASTFTSSFPYFIKCMTKNYVSNSLNIPACFSREHFKGYNREFVLRNTEGKRWIVKLLNSRGRYVFKGGWPAFIHGNKIENGDTLIFELVAKAEMIVYISSVRQGSNLRPKSLSKGSINV